MKMIFKSVLFGALLHLVGTSVSGAGLFEHRQSLPRSQVQRPIQVATPVASPVPIVFSAPIVLSASIILSSPVFAPIPTNRPISPGEVVSLPNRPISAGELVSGITPFTVPTQAFQAATLIIISR